MPVTRRLPATMRAALLDAPGAYPAVTVRELPVPAPGEVLIRVRAAGLDRHLRAPGPARAGVVEAVGVVVECPGRELRVGAQVAALLDDGAERVVGEYLCVPAAQVISFFSGLPWAVLGAVPRAVRTAYGALTFGLDARVGQTVLVRGGASRVGAVAVWLAARQGLTVIATGRTAGEVGALRSAARHVLLDDGAVAEKVRAVTPGGVSAALELSGPGTLPDTLRATGVHGVVCCAGPAFERAELPGFDPVGCLPRGVRLTGYRGRSTDLPPVVLQEFAEALAAGDAALPVSGVFQLEELGAAIAELESGRAAHPPVVLL